MAPSEATTEAKEVQEENSDRLNAKTWVLKVSIHCEGCKRKVMKVLKNIDGVYTTNVDLRQQKVTVKGTVEAGTLINKLIKAGKHAELWPEKAEPKEKKKSKSKNKEKQSDPESSDEGNHGIDKEKETVKVEVEVKVKDFAKNSEGGGSTSKNSEGGNVSKAREGGAPDKGSVEVKEIKPEVKQTVTLPASSQSPVAEKKNGGENENGAEKSGGGGDASGSKKKKKKGQNGNNNNNNVESEPSGGGAVGSTGFPNFGQGHGPVPGNHSPPRNHVYQYPPHYHTPPPVYAVSYNTAYPSSSYHASYYASPPSYSYAYMHPGLETEPPPSDFDSYPPHPSDSFEVFSDENPNACSVM